MPMGVLYHMRPLRTVFSRESCDTSDPFSFSSHSRHQPRNSGINTTRRTQRQHSQAERALARIPTLTMAAAPTLPFVVLRAHKPYSVDDIVSAAEQDASLPGRSSPSLTSTNTPRSGTGNDVYSAHEIPGATGVTTPSPAIHTRTIHPQVHYIFEDDPQEMDIMASIPRSRCITLDLDPRSGSITNVESFLPNLQVMDVKFVTSQAVMGTSSSSSASLNAPANSTASQAADGRSSTSVSNTAIGIGSSGGNPMALGRTGSSEALPLQSSFTTSAAASRMVRGSSDRSLVNQTMDGDNQGAKGSTREWGLVVEAVEVEENSIER